MRYKHGIVFLLVIATTTAGLVYPSQAKKRGKGESQESKTAAKSSSSSSAVQAVLIWEMPAELNEISANVLVDENRMACVQDNDGSIFVYNLKTESIEETIPFANQGDYEGLALVGSTYYVLRSDGFLYEVKTGSNNKPAVTTYDLPLTIENDTESMCYDKAGNRLLIGTKEKDLSGGNGNGVYGFDLATKKLSREPVMMISRYSKKQESRNKKQENGNDEDVKKEKRDEGGDKNRGKNNPDEIRPSDIAIHPNNGDVYVLDGPGSELLIVDATGAIKSSHQLDKKLFPQPEGMCFAPQGTLFISSEGGKNGHGVIARVDVNQAVTN